MAPFSLTVISTTNACSISKVREDTAEVFPSIHDTAFTVGLWTIGSLLVKKMLTFPPLILPAQVGVTSLVVTFMKLLAGAKMTTSTYPTCLIADGNIIGPVLTGGAGGDVGVAGVGVGGFGVDTGDVVSPVLLVVLLLGAGVVTTRSRFVVVDGSIVALLLW